MNRQAKLLNDLRRSLAVSAVLTVLCLIFIACPSPSGSDSTTETTEIPVPEVLSGTIAFPEIAATMVLNIGSSTALSIAGSRSIYSITGSIRYDGVTFPISSGHYESVSAAVSASSSTGTVAGHEVRFIILGVYSLSSGFIGSVERIIDGVADVNLGSITAVATTAAELPSVRRFLGTYGGSARGTWNMTLANNIVSGSYSGFAWEHYNYGTFHGTLSGTTITITAINDTTEEWTGAAVGSLVGTGVNGRWWDTSSEIDDTGTWTGAEVSETDDPVPPVDTDPDDYRFYAIKPVIDTALASVNFDDVGPTFYNDEATVSATITDDTPSSGQATISFSTVGAGFYDGLTGFTLGGTTSMVIGISDGYCLSASGDFTVAGTDAWLTSVSYDLTTNPTTHETSGTAIIDGASAVAVYY